VIPGAGAAGLAVVRAGALTTVQDLGRGGSAHLGVPPSGALDLPAHRLANLLVGNAEAAATLETTVTGCTLRAVRQVLVAVTGAACAIRVDGRPAAWGAPVLVPCGAVLDVGAATAGVRSYVGVAGGVAVRPVLGSRATDLLSGLGPAPLADGDVLPVGTDRGAGVRVGADVVPYGAVGGAEVVLPLVPGPRDDWFAPGAVRRLAASTYAVSSASNRIGLRTVGPAIARAEGRGGELPSEPLVRGAVQVPPDGMPVVFLADHPTTGGYPVIGVVAEPALSLAAQAVVGVAVRFVPRG
jgi:biotin-dependent carboxylase-like uncharacterized protein